MGQHQERAAAGGERPIRIRAMDSHPIAGTMFDPEGPAVGQVLVIPAMAVPQGYYRHFARYLATRGLRVLTFDYRGVGESRPPSLRGFRASLNDWARHDALGAYRRLVAEAPRLPFLMVGHSFGGQALGLVDQLGDADGALLVGAQLGYFRHWPRAWDRLRLAAIWGLAVPALSSAFGYLPAWAGLGDEVPEGVARQWARWCRSPGYLLDHEPGARDRFASVRSRVLMLSFEDDFYAPVEAVQALADALPADRLTRVHLRPEQVGLPEVGHFGFFRPTSAAGLWPLAAGFLDDVIQGRVPRPVRVPGVPPPAARAWGFPVLREEDVMVDLAYGRA